MTILDTSILIKRSKRRREITDNTTEVSVVEYPPLLEYGKFKGKFSSWIEKICSWLWKSKETLGNLGNPKDLLIF